MYVYIYRDVCIVYIFGTNICIYVYIYIYFYVTSHVHPNLVPAHTLGEGFCLALAARVE